MTRRGRLPRAWLLASVLLLWAVVVGGCDLGIRLSGTPPGPSATPRPRVAQGEPSATAPGAEGLGPKPVLAPPRAFEPKAPEVFQGPNGITVWLVERPTLPLVSATFVVPYGAASDPEGKPGTMHLALDMLDEGAGKRGAIEISEDISALGASLALYATSDGSFAQVTTLKRGLGTAFEILSDVVARPRFDPKEYQRVSKLWKNALKKRADDPMQVAGVTSAAVMYGPKTPYGHPVLGLSSRADAIDLQTLKKAYASAWRPERMTLVIVGQVTRPEIEALLQQHLASWKPAGAPMAPPALTAPLMDRPRVVVVDRPDAVQSVIAVVREGVEARDERAPSLSLVNGALGGSFTSRLNQNLREAKGWTYGVGSVFTSTRGQGTFVVRTSVEAKFTGAAVKEILGELGKMSADGLSPEELDKVKAQDRADLVETYETVSGTAARLATLVSTGLPPSFDAAASRLRQSATRSDLARLAREHVDPSVCTVVIVGDAKTITAQLSDAGLPAPLSYSVEGAPTSKAATTDKPAPEKP